MELFHIIGALGKGNKRTNRVFVYYFVFLLVIIATVLTGIIIFNVNRKDLVVNYDEEINTDYKVYLADNEFFTKNYLEHNRDYISEIIDLIVVNFKYNSKLKLKHNYIYCSKITANLEILGNDSKKILYNKEDVLFERDNIKTNENLNISTDISVDYNKYNDIANSFKSAYGLDTESYLIVTMKIKKDSLNEDSKFSISSDSDMYLTIPLSERAIDVELNFVDINRKSSMIVRERLVLKNTLYLVVAGFSIFMGLYVMIMTMRKYRVPDNNKVYDAYIKKLLREYDRLIAESKTIISFEDKEVIKVNTFNELLDIHDNLTLPIMYYNVTSHVKSYFYIAHQNIVYLYTVKASDLEIAKKK